LDALLGVAAASLASWVGLLLARGWFWWPSPRLSDAVPDTEPLPAVVAVIPARDEAEILPRTLPTVLGQMYSSALHVVLVDDCSNDGTSTVAQATADGSSHPERLTVLQGAPRPKGWAGKLWALEQGMEHAKDRPGERPPEYLWFTDADVVHGDEVLGRLVRRAESGPLDLVSVMATLRVDSFWDRLLIPAFVYFFAMLYPFRFVRSPRRRTAGAAGGCVLVRRTSLEQAGGLYAIRSALIDDCALGRLIKRGDGRLWLGYSREVRSVRRYGSLGSVWAMVSRSAYTQLGHSPPLLLATVLGMLFLYALPPCAALGGGVALLFAHPLGLPLLAVGGVAWLLMAISFAPLLRWHGAGAWTAGCLPLAGALYTAMTVSSACRHHRGIGGAWKGRTY
jgi:hopene-associated glycosyltransferase HpnB